MDIVKCNNCYALVDTETGVVIQYYNTKLKARVGYCLLA